MEKNVLSKEEFKTLVMLCAANIDGNIRAEEVNVILKNNDGVVFEKVSSMFSEMKDNEVIDCIRQLKEVHVSTDADRESLVNDCRAIIGSDKRKNLL